MTYRKIDAYENDRYAVVYVSTGDSRPVMIDKETGIKVLDEEIFVPQWVALMAAFAGGLTPPKQDE